MSKVKEGDNISMHYTGSLEDGTVFDSSEDSDPLSFTVGSGEIIEGFDAGVRDMEVGESKEIRIAPDKAYGDYHEELVKVVPRESFPPDVKPIVGMMFELQLPSGQSMPVRIIDIEGDDVTLDANHLLAGETLIFNVRLMSINNLLS
jgi:FKBP-type peptidyl-prolyl cis-trans isomerase 2